MDKMRDAFEKEFSKLSRGTAGEIKSLRIGERYCESKGDRLNTAWIIWQAALSQQPKSEPAAFSKNGNLFWYGNPTEQRSVDCDLYICPQPSAQVQS